MRCQAMLQALLEDRFKLAVHRETKNQQVLALVVAKGGPKLESGQRPSSTDRGQSPGTDPTISLHQTD